MSNKTPFQALRDLADVFNLWDAQRLTPERFIDLGKQYLPEAKVLDGSALRQAVLDSALRVIADADPFSPPSWSQAPAWALWLAQDYDGRWFWYGAKPEPLDQGVWSPADTGPSRLAKRVAERAMNSAWRETLQCRSEAS